MLCESVETNDFSIIQPLPIFSPFLMSCIISHLRMFAKVSWGVGSPWVSSPYKLNDAFYFLNIRIPIEIETHKDYLWVQSKFYQDCCLMLSSSLCPRSVKSLDLLGLYSIPTVEHYFVQILPQGKCLCGFIKPHP